MGKEERIIGLVYLFVLIFTDQLSKYLIRHFDGFYICNQGISFGIQLPVFLFYIFWIGIIFFLLFALYKKYYIQNTIYIILILAGALGNMTDRIVFGCVIDFIDLKIWSVFNLADIFISIGVILLIIKTFKK